MKLNDFVNPEERKSFVQYVRLNIAYYDKGNTNIDCKNETTRRLLDYIGLTVQSDSGGVSILDLGIWT